MTTKDVNQGPARWSRALANWQENPTSHGGKLFASRMEAVNTLDFHNLALWKFTANDKNHYTCSKKCAGLYVALNFRSTSVNVDHAFDVGVLELWNKWRERFDVHGAQVHYTDLTRSVRCFVCARQVLTDGVTLDDNRIPLNEFYEKPLADWERELMATPPAPAPVLAEESREIYFDLDEKNITHREPRIKKFNFTEREFQLFRRLSHGEQVDFLEKELRN